MPDRPVSEAHLGERCPTCGAGLIGYGRVCRACGKPVQQKNAPARPAPAAAIPDTRSEEEIRLAIRGVLELGGYVAVDLEQGYRADGSSRTRLGLADLYVMGRGRSAWIEVKSVTGKQSDHQRGFEADCRRAGIAYFLWRSETEAMEWVAAGIGGEERSA